MRLYSRSGRDSFSRALVEVERLRCCGARGAAPRPLLINTAHSPGGPRARERRRVISCIAWWSVTAMSFAAQCRFREYPTRGREIREWESRVDHHCWNIGKYPPHREHGQNTMALVYICYKFSVLILCAGNYLISSPGMNGNKITLHLILYPLCFIAANACGPWYGYDKMGRCW